MIEMTDNEKEQLKNPTSILKNTIPALTDLNTKEKKTKFLLEEFHRHSQCTYYQFGKDPIEGNTYFCEICDPNSGEPMCQYCFENCHKLCNKTQSPQEEEETKTKTNVSFYTCECGKKKHELYSKGDLVMDRTCEFLELDIKLRNKMWYSCTYCGSSILCYICYVYCHVSQNCKNWRKKINPYEQRNPTGEHIEHFESPYKGKRCECNGQNHSSIVIMNTYLTYTLVKSGRFTYDTIPFVWRQQIINAVFDTDIAEKMFYPVAQFVKSEVDMEERKIEKSLINILTKVAIDICTPLTIHFYHFHPKIEEMLPFESLCNILFKIKGKNLLNNADLAKSISSIILKVHLKRDFQNFKNFCAYDFLVLSIFDRLAYKKIITTESYYTTKFRDKYFPKAKGKCILPEFTNNIAKMLEKACNIYVSMKSLSRCMTDYFDFWKIIFFNLKRMTYDMESLVQFIDIFERLSDILQSKLKEIILNFAELEAGKKLVWWIGQKNLYSIMLYFTKITYLVAINYNDLVVEEYLLSTDYPKPPIKFLHSNNPLSVKLLKILISTSVFYTNFLFNQNIYNKNNPENLIDPTPGVKYLNLLNEAIEFYTISDNTYFKNLNFSTASEANATWMIYKKIINFPADELKYNITTKTSEIALENGYGGIESFSYKELNLSMEVEKNFDFIYKKPIFELRNKIEGCLDSFFLCRISLSALYSNVKKFIEEFGNSDYFKDVVYTKVVKAKMLMNYKAKKKENYLNKIIRDHKNLFKFLSNPEFIEQNEDVLNSFVSELMLSNIDVLLSKLFIIDPIVGNYPPEALDLIFRFLGLFCLTKEGVKYICLGRNLHRILKIFNKQQKRTLKFICLLFRGVYIFDVNISKHKRLNELMNLIKNYIKSYRIENLAQEEDFKEFLTQTIKFLKSLIKNLSFEEITIVKKQIFEYVEEKKLLDKEKIRGMFPVSLISQKGNMEEHFIKYFSDDVPTETHPVRRQSRNENLKMFVEKERRKNTFDRPNSLSVIAKPNVKFIENMKTIRTKQIDDANTEMISLLPKTMTNINRAKTENIERDPITLNAINFQTNEVLNDVKEIDKNIGMDTNNDPNTNIEAEQKEVIDEVKLQKDHEFFFSFIKLISEFTFYFVEKENIYEMINSFNDLDFYKMILNLNYLPLKYRINLLGFLRAIYLTDMLDANDYARMEKYLESGNYSKIISYMKNEEAKIKERSIRRKEAHRLEALLPRLENLNNMKKVVEIFIQETKNYLYHVFLNQNNPEIIDNYIKQLLFSIKIISDIYVTYEISSHMTLLFYELAREFLNNLNTFKNVLNVTSKKENYESIDLSELISPSVSVMETKDFDIFDTETIYAFVLNGFNDIFTETKINQKFRLQAFIEEYLDNENKNFSVFCLNDTEDYFENYLEEDRYLSGRTVLTKEPELRHSETVRSVKSLNKSSKKISRLFKAEDIVPVINVNADEITDENFANILTNFQNTQNNSNGLSVTTEDISGELAQLIKDYLFQFKDMHNTSFINVLNSTSQDIEINHRQIFFEYCFTHIIHLDKIPNDKFISAIIALNKLLLYDSDSTQEIMQNVLVKSSISQKFFSNFYSKLREMINVNLSICKNMLFNDRFGEITHKTNVLIKFIELVGDGSATDMQLIVITGKSYEEVIRNILTGGSSLSNQKNNNFKQIMAEELEKAFEDEGAEKKDDEKNQNPNEEFIPKFQEEAEKKEEAIKQVNKMEITDSIFGLLTQSLIKSLVFMDIKRNYKINAEMPYDKLVVLTTNCIMCMTQYFIGKFRKQYDACFTMLKPNLPRLKEFFFFDSEADDAFVCKNLQMSSENVFKIYNQLLTKRKLFIVAKIYIIELISSLLQEGNTPTNIRYTLISFFHPVEIFNVAIKSFRDFFEELKLAKKVPEYLDLDDPKDVELIIETLTELYIFDEKFQNSLQFKFAVKIFNFIKFLGEVYKNPIVLKLFEELDAIQTEDETYLFLYEKNETAEINQGAAPNNQADPQTIDPTNNQNFQNPNQNSANNISRIGTLRDQNNPNRENPNNVTANNQAQQEEEDEAVGIASLKNKICYKTVYLFFSKLLKRIEVRSQQDSSRKDFTYFLVPPICNLLTTQSKDSFNNNVDRDSTHSKIGSLIDESDYFIYEMFYNSRLLKKVGNSKFTRYLYNINMFNCEVTNYCFIVLENILLLVQFNEKIIEGNDSDESGNQIFFSQEEKYQKSTLVVIVCLIQLASLSLLFIVWLKYKFPLYFQHKVMKNYNKKFILGHTEKYFDSADSLVEGFNSEMGILTRIKVGIWDAILNNPEINIFVYSFLFILGYLLTGFAILLVVPILFIANLSSILLGIVLAFTLRKFQILAVLMFTYLFIYLFAWIEFYFFYDSLHIEGYISKTGESVEENYCDGALKCFLFNIDYGLRSGGGIADVMPTISYEGDLNYFIARMILNLTFHAMIILIMLNLFLGIIVDTFADLRDKNTNITYDKENVCFICQINRDGAVKENIDFDKHVEFDHNVWNYVYFITFLNISNPLNFTSLEYSVWSKLREKDISWIPLQGGGEAEE